MYHFLFLFLLIESEDRMKRNLNYFFCFLEEFETSGVYSILC